MTKYTLVLAALLAGAAPAAAQANDAFPNKPIRFLVPYPAGSGTDNAARNLAEHLRQALGQPVVVENRPGGNTVIATRALLASPPDGYTILLSTNGFLSIAPALSRSMDIDTVKGFTHLGFISNYPHLVVTRADNPVTNLQQFIDRAQAKPNSVSYMVVGHVTAIAGAMMRSRSGTELLEVRYKGSNEAISDIMAGRVDMGFVGPGIAKPMLDGGKLKVIAVTTAQRYPAMPRVPTISESVRRLEGFDTSVWSALVAPPGLPPEVSAKLSKALAYATAHPRFKKEMERVGEYALQGGGEAVQARINQEIPLWRVTVQKANVPLID